MAGLIIIPFDGSWAAEHAIPYGRRIARLSESELRLIHVHAPAVRPAFSRWLTRAGRASALAWRRRLQREDAGYLERVADRVAAGPTRVRVSWVVLEGQVDLIGTRRGRPDSRLA